MSAGRGSRLLPLTLAMPKCLVQVGGRAILDHQLDALDEAGVDRAIVVAGYRAAQVADHIAASRRRIEVEFVFNPFWAVASSIASVWAARTATTGPFCLMNGDTVFDAAVIRHALAAARPGVNLVVERAAAYEIDDMRVRLNGDRVVAVGKTLADAAHRSLGLIVSRDGDGGGYARALGEVIAAEDGLNAYHHDVIARLTDTGAVHAIVEQSAAWQEIDRPQDIAAWSRGHASQAGKVA